MPTPYGEELQHKMDNLSINPHAEPLSTPPISARSDQSYEVSCHLVDTEHAPLLVRFSAFDADPSLSLLQR